VRTLVLALTLIACAATAAPPPHLPRGEPAPDFKVERLVGGELTLASLRGRVVIIDFWATWCPPCRAELPWLLKLARRYESRGVVFVAMNQDDGPQRALATEFASELPGIDRFITLGGPSLAGPYRVDGLPTMYVIDAQGRVFASAEGRLTEEAVVGVLEQALKVR